jgi:anaerobic ribonucleoside-triphosphate reductase activating protein
LLGGEPLEPQNQKALYPFLKRVKEIYPNKDIWCYTGYLFDKELLNDSRAKTDITLDMLSLIDVLVDGRFIESQKNISLNFRGSENQRIILVKQSLEKGEIVLHELNNG